MSEVTPEHLEHICEIINRYQNCQCVECADEIETYLKQRNISGRRIKLDTIKQVEEDNYIIDDSLPPGSDAIATNDRHEGIGITINGEEKIFDNHHPDRVPTLNWIKNLTFFSKEFDRASFRESGYLF